jgi:hypothetical protein
LHALIIWDEHHRKVKLGHSSKWETRVSRHPDTGLVCPESAGGVYPKSMPNTTCKYPGEARGLFGVGIRHKNEEGQDEGVRCDPFCYTNRKVVGVKAYETAMNAEKDRVKRLGKISLYLKHAYAIIAIIQINRRMLGGSRNGL